MATNDFEGWPPSNADKARNPLAGAEIPPFLRSSASVYVLLFVVIAMLMRATGNHGFTNIKATQIGVLVNYVTGSTEIIVQPGFKLYLPFIEHVYTFDRTTQQFQMEGQRYQHDNHTPLLTVRASDGSNFRIDDLTILYEIIPGEAELVLHDSGPGTGFKEEWIKAYARSVLRDEFGRYTAVEVANPTIYKQAPALAAQRLSRLLEPHGLRIVRINTPNPQFDAAYEGAIEDRKEADQEVERLIAESLRLGQLRAQRLAVVNKEKEVERQELVGDLTKKLLKTQEIEIQLRKEADVYATERIAEGTATQQEMLNIARGLEVKYRKEAEGIESRALALAQQGEVVVREALIEKLTQIEFTLVPYSRDAEPRRLEHIDAKSPAQRSATQGDN